MDENLEKLVEAERKRHKDEVNKTIANELTPQGDLLPPWRKYPQIQAGSIGWRMGYGEFYMDVWHTWAERKDQEQLIEYFRNYLPIPVDWLTWVSIVFGDTKIVEELYASGGSFDGVRWLEQQGLVSFPEFKTWYDAWYDRWKRRKE